MKNNLYQQAFFTKVDSNHFHIDPIIVSGGKDDVKMWNDVVYKFNSKFKIGLMKNIILLYL